MSRTYNIPADYRVDKGIPVEFLSQKIKDEKCKSIFENQVEAITWKFHLINDDDKNTPGSITSKKGICVFEVKLMEEVEPELMAEIIAGFLPRRMILCFVVENKMALVSYIPGEYGLPPSLQASKYINQNDSDVINILDPEKDLHKDYKTIQRRIISTIYEKKKELLINQAFEKVKLKKRIASKNTLDEFDILFSQANLDKIREDAEYVEEQLRVDL